MAINRICSNCGVSINIGEMCECDHDMFNMAKVMEDIEKFLMKQKHT